VNNINFGFSDAIFEPVACYHTFM